VENKDDSVDENDDNHNNKQKASSLLAPTK